MQLGLFPISRGVIFSRLFFLTQITMPRMIARVSAKEKLLLLLDLLMRVKIIIRKRLVFHKNGW